MIVLNNSGFTGLAAQAKQRFELGGWTVSETDENYVNRIRSTAAYYDPSVPNARAAAELLQKQYPTIKRVVPEFDGLPAAPIVVVLTTDYSVN